MNDLLFFLSSPPNPRFIKQLNYLSSRNYNVTLVYYNRRLMPFFSDELDPDIFIVKVGDIPSYGNFIIRSFGYFKSYPKLLYTLSKIKHDSVLVNRHDSLLLYLFCTMFKKRFVIVEIADVPEYAFKNDFISVSFNWFEKLIFKKFVDKLIVTSPKYIDHHYINLVKRDDTFVLENKPLSFFMPRLANTESCSREGVEKIVIGCIGIIRLKAMKFLIDSIKSFDNFEVHIHGDGVGREEIEKLCIKYNNVKYFGPYNFFKQISEIYNSIDIVYIAYEVEINVINNMNIALPNKMYESMYFNKPVIVSENTYLSERVLNHGIGEAIQYGNSVDLVEKIHHIGKNMDTYLNRLKSLDKNEYIADFDYENLDRFLNKSETYV
jgi:succinoglycan biosynthesis protein ExoL